MTIVHAERPTGDTPAQPLEPRPPITPELPPPPGTPRIPHAAPNDIVSVSLVPVNGHLLLDHPDLPPLARWAVLLVDGEGRHEVSTTDADIWPASIVAAAERTALLAGVPFEAPTACEYCGSPTQGTAYCLVLRDPDDPAIQPRDCEQLDRGREVRYLVQPTVSPFDRSDTAGRDVPAWVVGTRAA